jgi:5-methylcytosine-specific restriction endonuclease McrA
MGFLQDFEKMLNEHTEITRYDINEAIGLLRKARTRVIKKTTEPITRRAPKKRVSNFVPPTPEQRAQWDREQEEYDKAILSGAEKSTPGFRFQTLRRSMTPEKVRELKYMPYKAFLKTDYWASMRAHILYRARYRCQLCGNSSRLSVHHRTYDHRGEEYEHLSDLIALCYQCHAKHHDKVVSPQVEEDE